MPYNLKGRNVLVTGGSRGLGALVARKLAAEECNVAINYISSLERAEKTARSIQDDFHVQTFVVQGDVGVHDDCVNMVRRTIEALGGLDVIVSNAGWTKFTAFGNLHAMTEADWDKCWAVNVKGNLHLLREAAPTFNGNEEGGVFLITSSLAAVSPSGSSLPYSVTKAAGLHLMKALAVTQGPKIRVNAILPGLLLTEWGQQFTNEQQQVMADRATLKRVTDLEDCANAFVATAKNGSMTGQEIQVDSGMLIR
ncbi:hypothetical protein LTR84_007780 [Exophiala bonariae]|uniref:Uncharacterized protein n=1 Tax=Exophiala bonariae TaxID=1690606 RepID=A0AAV9NM18_9EURO|nr:hypothetical protein LTR84_007780 [Exophiala bonariae]